MALDLNDLIALNTAHDVRHLRQCLYCKKLGDARRMINTTIPTNIKSVKQHVDVHGRCFIKRRTLKVFLALPKSETDKACLGDIGVRSMRALINHNRKGSN